MFTTVPDIQMFTTASREEPQGVSSSEPTCATRLYTTRLFGRSLDYVQCEQEVESTTQVGGKRFNIKGSMVFSVSLCGFIRCWFDLNMKTNIKYPHILLKRDAKLRQSANYFDN